MPGSHALWPLIMGTVFFITAYCLVITMFSLAPQLQAGSFYENITIHASDTPNKVQLGQFNIFNESGNNNLTYGTFNYGTKISNLQEEDLWVDWLATINLYGYPDGYISVMGRGRGAYDFGLGNPLTLINAVHDKRFITQDDFIANLDPVANTSSFSMYDNVLTFTITFTPNDTSESLISAVSNHHALKFAYSAQPNFTNMGANIWTALARFMTFATVQTGVAIIDYSLNMLITLPIYIALFYTGYRLVTGLIPTMSGGGGA